MQDKKHKADIKAILIRGPNLVISKHAEQYTDTPGAFVIKASSQEQVFEEITKIKDRVQPHVRVDLDCHGMIDSNGEHLIQLSETSFTHTKNLFEFFDQNFATTPINMQVWQCFSGVLIRGKVGNQVDRLPKGSTLITHSGKNDFSHQLIAYFCIVQDLEIFGEKKEALSLEEYVSFVVG
jgi:hypothetical protein